MPTVDTTMFTWESKLCFDKWLHNKHSMLTSFFPKPLTSQDWHKLKFKTAKWKIMLREKLEWEGVHVFCPKTPFQSAFNIICSVSHTSISHTRVDIILCVCGWEGCHLTFPMIPSWHNTQWIPAHHQRHVFRTLILFSGTKLHGHLHVALAVRLISVQYQCPGLHREHDGLICALLLPFILVSVCSLENIRFGKTSRWSESVLTIRKQRKTPTIIHISFVLVSASHPVRADLWCLLWLSGSFVMSGKIILWLCFLTKSWAVNQDCGV